MRLAPPVFGAILGGLIAWPSAADAQTTRIEPFRACSETPDAGERLACFENALAAAEQALTAREDGRSERTKADFGLSERQIVDREQRDRAEPTQTAETERNEPEPERVIATVADLFTDGRRRRVFLLDNGQLWRETSHSNYRGQIEEGSRVTIEEGLLSGYRLTVEGGAGFFGVRRIR